MVAEEWDPRARCFSGVIHPLSSKPPTSERNPGSPEELRSARATGGNHKLPPTAGTERWKEVKRRQQNIQRKRRGKGTKGKKGRRITWQGKKKSRNVKRKVYKRAGS